jgi:predicted dehydrogenase
VTRGLRVGILGAGQIAAGFDSPADPRILTLAHAVQASKGLHLGGFFDMRPERAAAAERKWGCLPSPRQRTAWLDAGWDVVFIATPDEAHAADFRDVLHRRPRAVLMEKPFAPDGQEALRLMRAAERARVPVLLDFPRREHPGIRHVTALIRMGSLGAVTRISGVYSGGLQHSGIHLLDLVAAWVPDIRRVHRVGGKDGVTHLRLEAAAGTTTLLLSDAAQADTYVWELRVETARARIELSGAPETLRIFRRGAHPNYPRFTTLLESRAWPMEETPLLLGVARRLARLAASPAAARAQWALESDRQRFFNRVLAHVRAPLTSHPL